jgi:hypothetical protein
MQLEIGEFFESVNDALRAIVVALGGYKKVGALLRVELPMAQAEAWVRHCLDESRREKFSPEQVMVLLREARKVGFHAGMDFIASDVGYKAQPVDLEQQVQSLEETIAQGLQTLNAQMASLTRIKERAGM